jgi:hypothetical protein
MLRCKLCLLIGVNACLWVRRVFTGAEEEDDAVKIQEIDIADYARQLLEAHGAQAVVEAAQKASAFETEGKKDDAEVWRHIEAALQLMLGPHES